MDDHFSHCTLVYSVESSQVLSSPSPGSGWSVSTASWVVTTLVCSSQSEASIHSVSANERRVLTMCQPMRGEYCPHLVQQLGQAQHPGDGEGVLQTAGPGPHHAQPTHLPIKHGKFA